MDKFLKPERFDADQNPNMAAKQWLRWQRTFANFITAIATHNPDKLNMLIDYIAPPGCEFIAEYETYNAAIDILCM